MTKQALYLAEHKAREAVATRADIHRELLHNAKQAKEAELRNLARLARADRVNLNNDNKTSVENGAIQSAEMVLLKEKETRNSLRDERKRERERERRLDIGDSSDRKKSSKLAQNRDRDVSEQIALGHSNVQTFSKHPPSYDQRLFDKQQGVASGFHSDDVLDIYDEPIFQRKSGTRESGAVSTNTEDAQKGLRAVEFKQQISSRSDPFGLDTILSEVKRR